MANAESIANRFTKKYGHQAASTARFRPHRKSTSTGILALDYALGTGGWPEGAIVEVYGPRDIGKSSIVGLSAIVEAQKDGKVCGLVALEPNFSPDWAERHGVDLDRLIITWPDDGKKAFDMLFDMVQDPDISTIVFDSIGALLRESEAGDKGKPSQGGQSALITWGIKRIQMPAWKLHKTIILINQIRDDMDAYIPGMVKPPGGHALEHTAEIHVQLKPGSDRYTVKEGEGKLAHDVLVGRSIVAVVARNKRNEGTNQRAVFDFYQKQTDEYPFGLDRIKDTILTGKRLGVLRVSGAWHYHDAFPEGKLQGYDATYEFLRGNPLVLEELRERTRNIINGRTPAVQDFAGRSGTEATASEGIGEGNE